MATSHTGSGELSPGGGEAEAQVMLSRTPSAQSCDTLSATGRAPRQARSFTTSGSSEHLMVTLRMVSALYVRDAPGPELSTVLARCRPPSTAVSRNSRSNVDPTGSSCMAWQPLTYGHRAQPLTHRAQPAQLPAAWSSTQHRARKLRRLRHAVPARPSEHISVALQRGKRAAGRSQCARRVGFAGTAGGGGAAAAARRPLSAQQRMSVRRGRTSQLSSMRVSEYCDTAAMLLLLSTLEMNVQSNTSAQRHHVTFPATPHPA